MILPKNNRTLFEQFFPLVIILLRKYQGRRISRHKQQKATLDLHTSRLPQVGDAAFYTDCLLDQLTYQLYKHVLTQTPNPHRLL